MLAALDPGSGSGVTLYQTSAPLQGENGLLHTRHTRAGGYPGSQAPIVLAALDPGSGSGVTLYQTSAPLQGENGPLQPCFSRAGGSSAPQAPFVRAALDPGSGSGVTEKCACPPLSALCAFSASFAVNLQKRHGSHQPCFSRAGGYPGPQASIVLAALDPGSRSGVTKKCSCPPLSALCAFFASFAVNLQKHQGSPQPSSLPAQAGIQGDRHQWRL